MQNKDLNKDNARTSPRGESRETSRDSLSRRRFPRVFLSTLEEDLTPLSGVLLALPDRTHLPILAISSAGLILSPIGVLSQLRLGQVLDCKLKFSAGADPLLARFRVIRLTSSAASLALDVTSFDERLKFEQVLKDQIIFSNLRSQSPRSTATLPQGFNDAQWWAAPFDTNFLAWFNHSLLERLIIEYDGVILSAAWSETEHRWIWNLKRSIPTVDEVRGYASPWFEDEAQKISMGSSWKNRLIRLLDSSTQAEKLRPFIDFLKKI